MMPLNGAGTNGGRLSTEWPVTLFENQVMPLAPYVACTASTWNALSCAPVAVES